MEFFIELALLHFLALLSVCIATEHFMHGRDSVWTWLIQPIIDLVDIPPYSDIKKVTRAGNPKSKDTEGE